MLIEDGDEVIGLRRDVSRLHADVPGIVPFAADLSNSASLVNLPQALDAVVYAVGAVDSSDAAYRAAYVDGLRHLLVALTQQDPSPQRIVFTSSTGVYPQDDGSRVDEDTPLPPIAVEGRVDRVREGELLLQSFPFRSIVVRLGGIYGPGRTRFVESVRNGTIRYRLDPPQWTNRIHRDDAAGAVRHLLRSSDPESVYVGVDDEPAPLFEVVRYVADRIGLPVPPPSQDGSRGGGKRCSNRRLCASGYAFRYPSYREGYAALLRDP